MAQIGGERTRAPGFYDLDQHAKEFVYEFPGDYAMVNREFDIEVSEDVSEAFCRKNMVRSASGPYFRKQCREEASQG